MEMLSINMQEEKTSVIRTLQTTLILDSYHLDYL